MKEYLNVRSNRPLTAAAELRELACLLLPTISAHEYANPIHHRKRYFAGCLALRGPSSAGGGVRQVIGFFGL